jgi:predicted RNA-binding protein YlxR (DUF448 family)
MDPDPEQRTCCRCGETKPVSEFAWRRKAKGQRDTFCRPCRSAYGRTHYEANKQRYIAQAAVVKRRLALERTRFLLKFFETHPCVDCGETNPVVLEFDHLRDKSFSIGGQLTTRSWQAILDEIEKCEVVCANCHRIRTAERRGTVRGLLNRALEEGSRSGRPGLNR